MLTGMARFLTALALALTLTIQAQDSTSRQSADRSGLSEILSFEAQHTGDWPAGWGGGPAGTVFADDKIVHGGKWSARIERNAASPNQFSTLTKSIPVNFTGSKIELRGFLRTEEASDFVGLWLREDGESPNLAFDNMQARRLRGTTGWTEYSIVLPVHKEATQLFFGVLLAGTGKAWVDDLQLLLDGKPISDAPKVERPKTALDLDHEFDGGSGIALNQLTTIQIDNLATLGKVWGFLKYHHPQLTSGQHQWDYGLFRVMPAILAARDRAASSAALLRWIIGLGSPGSCEACAQLDESNIQLRPEVDWIADEELLGKELSQKLRSIYRNRPADRKQFYVSLSPGVGNPIFDHELGYQRLKLPDEGFQILAVYRFWNIIKYWYPYRDVLGEDWSAVLTQFIPRVGLAKTADAYQRELMALIARVHDTHANLWSSLQVRPPTGACRLPVNVRFIADQAADLAVIIGYAGEDGAATGLKVGDVITELDGVAIPKLVEGWSPYYAASNEPTRLRDIARSMTLGECSESAVRVLRENETLQVKVKRLPLKTDLNSMKHDLPGETFRLLSDEVAYLKLSSVKMAEAAHYVEAANGTKGLIIDIRNYPSEFMVFALGSLLVGRDVEFVRFTYGDLSNPGAFHWTKLLSLSPKNPHYSGKVIIFGRRSLSEPGRVHQHGLPHRAPGDGSGQHHRRGRWQRVTDPSARRSTVHDQWDRCVLSRQTADAEAGHHSGSRGQTDHCRHPHR
jgi:hypothetical protein